MEIMLLLCLTVILSSIECCFVAEPTGYGDDFSISVARNVTVQAGLCMTVACKFTYPPHTVTEPYERVWFKGDPLNPVFEVHAIQRAVILRDSERYCSLHLEDARKGQTDGDYRFMLKWGDKHYVFSETVHVSVTGISSKPEMDIPLLIEHESATLSCTAPGYCSGKTPTIKWKGKAVEYKPIKVETMRLSTGVSIHHSELRFISHPTYHNTILTCTVVYLDDILTEQHVTLIVKQSPKIQKQSRCNTDGILLICVCVSHGVPLPITTWPPVFTSQNYSITTSVFNDYVTSTITTSAEILRANDTVWCLSKNELGQANMSLQVVYTARVEDGKRTTDTENSDPNTTTTTTMCKDLLQGPDQCKLPWTLTSLSVALNGFLALGLVLLAVAWKRSKTLKVKEEHHLYSSIGKRDEPDYDTIGKLNQHKTTHLYSF